LKRDFYKELLAVVLLATTISVRAESGDGAWPLCPSALPIPERPQIETALEPGEIHISADKAELEKKGISTLEGNVEITRDEQQVTADDLTYDEPGGTADLSGNVQYWDNALYLRGDKGHIDFNKDSGLFENSNYVLRDNRARGRADELAHEYQQRTDLKNVDYTTCDPEDNFWKLSASNISLDHVQEWGTARNVVLRIKDVPVLYSPYLSFPISNKRKTGFLFPSFGSSNSSGYELTTPFYWNIAPEMDMTLAPRILSDRGLMLTGEFRYLLDRGEGSLAAEYLPGDNEYNDKDRNLLGFTHQQLFGKTGKLFLTYNRVSDKQYFEDFGNNIILTSTRYLERRADASYRGSWWKLSGMVQSYQTVDRSIPVTSRPYKRLPQIRFNAFSPERNRQLNFDLQSEISYFDRSNNDVLLNDVNGLRFDLYPSISYPIHTAYSFFEPRAGVRFTQYQLNDTGSLFESSPNRLLPVLSVDSGLFLERETNMFNTPLLHTLEPRLFYLYIPHDNQTDLPVFDTGLNDFSFDSMFRDNRFTGPDRMGDANQFTLSVTSRLLNQTGGREVGYVSLGQIYYMYDRDVFLPNGKARTEISSPFIATIGASLTDAWRLRGSLQWDPNNNKTEKLVAFAQYHPEPDKIVNLGYRVRHTTDSISSSSKQSVTNIEQSEFSFLWPLAQNWNVMGRWNYAPPEERTVDLFGGLEYNSCCFAFRVVARRFITDISGDYNNGLFFQVELKGLAGIGQQTDKFLQENIPGFQSGF
jgi:LPS-assembly protein